MATVLRRLLLFGTNNYTITAHENRDNTITSSQQHEYLHRGVKQLRQDPKPALDDKAPNNEKDYIDAIADAIQNKLIDNHIEPRNDLQDETSEKPLNKRLTKTTTGSECDNPSRERVQNHTPKSTRLNKHKISNIIKQTNTQSILKSMYKTY